MEGAPYSDQQIFISVKCLLLLYLSLLPDVRVIIAADIMATVEAPPAKKQALSDIAPPAKRQALSDGEFVVYIF